MSPLYTCTGAVIHEDLCGDHDIPQIDTMIWWPGPSPAIFQKETFALVPRGSCYAILEIKSSTYSESGAKAEKILNREREFFDNFRLTLGGKVQNRALGVFCIENLKPDRAAKKLIESGRAVSLLRQKQDDEYEANGEGIFTLINFLLSARALAIGTVGMAQINTSVAVPQTSTTS